MQLNNWERNSIEIENVNEKKWRWIYDVKTNVKL